MYNYDAANRLIEVDGVAYSWDANGNLLSDGASSYSYNTANRLVGVSQGGDAYSFVYNGLSDRLQQVVNGDTTSYTLDLNTGLTQVLADEQYISVWSGSHRRTAAARLDVSSAGRAGKRATAQWS